MEQKPTMNAEINQLFRTQFSLFQDYETNARVEQIEKIMYIQDIAGKLNKNIQGINLFELFPNNNNIILAEKTDINRILATFKREDFITEDEKIVVLLDDDQASIIGETMKTFRDINETKIQSKIDSKIYDAQYYSNEYMRYLKEASTLRIQLENLKNNNSNFVVDGINKLLETGKYSINSQTNSNIELLINHDVILTQKNTRANIDLRVNLGQFKIVVEYGSGSLNSYVRKHDNNITVHHFIHPHVENGTNGYVCFGNMDASYTDAVRELDVFKMVETIYKVLTNYNHENPYKPLSLFVERSEQIQSSGETFESEPRYQVHECHECSHEEEIEFRSELETNYVEYECADCDNYNEVEWDYDR